MKLVYIAGPFRAADAWEVHCNVHRAELASREIAGMGAMPVAPHSIGAHMDGTETAEFWLSGTLELMRRCDAVLVLSGYEHSAGTLGEIQEARRLGLPIFLPHFFGAAFNLLAAWLRDGVAVHSAPVLPLSDNAPDAARCRYCGKGFAVVLPGQIFCGETCRSGAVLAARNEALDAIPEAIKDAGTAKIEAGLAAAQWAEVNSQGSDYPDGAVRS